MSDKRKDYISWDEYFMGIALLSANRSKDPNTQVGSCIVSKDNRILSSMGIKMSEIEGSLRVSFSSNNTEEDVDYFITEFENVVNEYLKSTNRRN